MPQAIHQLRSRWPHLDLLAMNQRLAKGLACELCLEMPLETSMMCSIPDVNKPGLPSAQEPSVSQMTFHAPEMGGEKVVWAL